MKQTKLEFENIVHAIMSDETDRQAKARKQVISANGSCLTCKYTKSQAGVFLICSLKNKKVREYTYCDKWKSEFPEETNHD